MNIARQQGVWQFCRRHPTAARRIIRRLTIAQLPEGFDVDTHFNPPYDPWDQRLCTVPDGDLFRVIRAGRADVVTDTIDRFTAGGVRLASGRELAADVIVTATGLRLLPFAGLDLVVDGEAVRLPQRTAYQGMMLSGIPNFAFAIGYTNSSWTLKVGLLCEHFCRLLRHMREQGYVACAPVADESARPARPLLDFGAGYVRRAADRLPVQGPGAPWQMSMSYYTDARVLRRGPLLEKHLRFARVGEQLPLAENVP